MTKIEEMSPAEFTDLAPAAAAVATRPRSDLERFDYSPLGTRWAVMRLVTRLREDIGLPTTTRLIVEHPLGGASQHFPARACFTDRRLRQSERGTPSLLWRGVFAVPVRVAEAPDASFALYADDELIMALPAPARRTITPRSLRLAPPPPARAGALAGLASRRRATAVATAAVLTGMSSPAAAFASSGTTGSGAMTTTAQTGSASSAPTPATPAAVTSTTATPTTTTTTAIPTTAATTTATTATTPVTATAPATSTSPPRTPPVAATATKTASTTATATALATATKNAAATSAQRATINARRIAAAQRTAASVRTAAAHGAAVARAAAGERRSAAARRIAIIDAGIRQTADRKQVAAHAERARQHIAARTAATSQARTAASSAPVGVHLLSTAPGMNAPTSWTGFAAAQSTLTGAVRDLSGLLANGDRPPSFLIPIYMEAGRRYHVPWEVLAAINAIESDYGRDLNTSSAGAIGWMQFEPSTWRHYAIAADGVSEANPYDPRDAIFAAAHYLQAAGGSTDIREAVFAYNHAGWYVDEVLQRAQAISEHVQYEREMVTRRGAVSVYFDTDLKAHPRVRYTGGVLSRYDRMIAAANMVSAAGFPYLWGGGHEQPSRFGPFDCSGSVSYVMQQAGYRVGTTVAADIGAWKLPSGPGQVTIFYSATHTFMRIDGRFFGTSGFARPGGGAGWFDVDRLPAGYLAGFREVHVPHLGINSFSADAALPLGRAPLTPRARQATRERAAVAAAAEERAGVLDSQAVSDRRLIEDLVAHGLHLLRPTSGR